MPAGQLTDSKELDGDEKLVDDPEEKVVPVENDELEPLCRHVPSDCSDVPDGQFTGSDDAAVEYVVALEYDCTGAV